jgi:glycosyltransferase involved in cell wall biosynthesis
MTLLLNYRPVLCQPTGIGVYANAVLPALQGLPHRLLPGGEQGTAKQRLKRLIWTQLDLRRQAQQAKASLIFTPAPEGYLGRQRIPQVVMVHDLRPISHPERSLQSAYFCRWVPPLLRQCVHILTNSLFTAREIQRCTRVADHRITVTPLGFSAEMFNLGGADNVQDVWPEDSGEPPYLLHVGQAYPHKNLHCLIQAFAKVAAWDSELQLVLAGKPHPTESPRLAALVDELGLGKRVQFRSYVSAAELPGLYRGALAFVYPSLWEGFGLPVLEAMACGTPVITSLGSGTEEVAGDAALLVDPHNQAALDDALLRVVRDQALLPQLRRLGIERARQFSWEVTATKTAEVLRGLMR